jgi:hypothetical protein
VALGMVSTSGPWMIENGEGEVIFLTYGRTGVSMAIATRDLSSLLGALMIHLDVDEVTSNGSES